MLVAEAVAAGWDVEGQFVARRGRRRSTAPAPVRELAAGVAERVARHRDARRACSPWSAAAVAAPTRARATAGLVLVADRRRRSRQPRHDPALGRGCRRRGRRAHRRAPSTRSTRRSCGHRRGRCSTSRSCRPTLGGRPRGAGLRLVGTSSHHGTSHVDVDWTGRVAIVLGSEAHGLAADDRRRRLGAHRPRAAAPRASTWRWPPPSCASRPPPPAADPRMDRNTRMGNLAGVHVRRERRFRCPGWTRGRCRHPLTRRYPSPPGVDSRTSLRERTPVDRRHPRRPRRGARPHRRGRHARRRGGARPPSCSASAARWPS